MSASLPARPSGRHALAAAPTPRVTEKPHRGGFTERARNARSRLGFSLLLACAFAPGAQAGTTYTLDRAAAAPGETVRVQAVYVNDGGAGVRWRPASELVLQWRSASGVTVRSLAQAETSDLDINIPVNNFARLSWRAVVPVQVNGLQAVSIEGEPTLMALDATATGTAAVSDGPAVVPVVDARTGQPVPPAAVAAAGASPTQGPAPTEAGVATARARNTGFDAVRAGISGYEPIYFDLRPRERTTARFQLSFKYRLFAPSEDGETNVLDGLYLGYTQTSLWDLEGDSRPFIDTTFNPSVFWLSDNIWTSRNQNWRFGLQTGVEHASNGKAGEDSRSVNDVYVQPNFHYRFDGGSTLTFGPRIKGYFALEDQNHNYADYTGYVDWKLRYAQDNGLIATALYRQGDAGRRTTQLDLAWPLRRTWLNMNGYLHLQYFNGYGETLLGYDQRNRSQIGIGLSLVQ